MTWSKQHRAEFFKIKCDNAHYKGWGAIKRLARDLGVSHSKVANWYNEGALPRGHEEIKRVADYLQIDVMEWVYGIGGAGSRELDASRLTACIGYANTRVDLSPNEFAEYTTQLYLSDVSLEALKRLSILEETIKSK